MAQQIYVNIPVKDLGKSKRFFTKLGFEFNAQFTNEQGACMVVGENIFVMLLAESFFKTFITKSICDTKKNAEVLICINADSRKKVDEMVKKAVHAGGRVLKDSQDHGFMYAHGFEDIDGHLWEIVYMDHEAIEKK